MDPVADSALIKKTGWMARGMGMFKRGNKEYVAEKYRVTPETLEKSKANGSTLPDPVAHEPSDYTAGVGWTQNHSPPGSQTPSAPLPTRPPTLPPASTPLMEILQFVPRPARHQSAGIRPAAPWTSSPPPLRRAQAMRVPVSRIDQPGQASEPQSSLERKNSSKSGCTLVCICACTYMGSFVCVCVGGTG